MWPPMESVSRTSGPHPAGSRPAVPSCRPARVLAAAGLTVWVILAGRAEADSSSPGPFYQYETVARRDADLLDVTPYPSINDKGAVAFPGIARGRGVESIFVVDEAGQRFNATGIWPGGSLVALGDGDRFIT